MIVCDFVEISCVTPDVRLGSLNLISRSVNFAQSLLFYSLDIMEFSYMATINIVSDVSTKILFRRRIEIDTNESVVDKGCVYNYM